MLYYNGYKVAISNVGFDRLRHIILHHHIFKNAGSTLDFSLISQFKTNFMHLEEGENPIHGNKLVEILDCHPGLKAVSSHNFEGQTFEQALGKHSYRALNFAMVRRPFQRLLSIYKYFRRSEPVSALARLAKMVDLRSFATTLIELYPHMVDNPQVNIVANDGFYGHPVSDSDLDGACARLATFSLCAPVERYDEAMVALEYFGSPAFPPSGLNMAYLRQNVSSALPGEDRLREILGEDCYDWIERLSERDERLWCFSNAELDRRLSIVPDFDRRLVSFQERCKALRSSHYG